MNTTTTSAPAATMPLDDFLERIAAHALRAKSLGGAIDDAFCDLLSHVELRGEVARDLGERLSALLDVTRREINDADRLMSDRERIIDGRLATSSIGKHVETRQRTDFAEAVAAYHAAEAVPLPEPCPDEVFDVIGGAASDAFIRMVQCRSPNLRCLHEKMTIIDKADGWSANGVISALFADVEQLARKHEIAGRVAAQAEG